MEETALPPTTKSNFHRQHSLKNTYEFEVFLDTVEYLSNTVFFIILYIVVVL